GIRDFHVTGVQTCALPISTIRSAKPGASPDDDACASPPLEEAAFVPVPEQVDQYALSPDVGIGDGQPDATGEPDVLPRIEGHLHSRYDIPVDAGPAGERTRSQHLNHRRPVAPETSLRETLAHSRPPEGFGVVAPFEGKSEPHLCLDK